MSETIRSPYVESGVSRKSLFSKKRKRVGADLDGVSKAYSKRKIDKNYKAQGISLRAGDLWRNY